MKSYFHCTICISVWFTQMRCYTTRKPSIIVEKFWNFSLFCLSLIGHPLSVQWLSYIYILFQSKAFLQIFPSYVTSLDQCITWIRWSTYCVIGRVCSKMRNRNRNTNIVVFGNKKKNNGHLWLHVSRNLSLKCDFNEQNSFKMYLRRFEKYSIPFGKKNPPKILQVAERS